MTRIERLKVAVVEANRFLERADAAIRAHEEHSHYWNYPRESGACKRASMDLTRALAEYRKGTE